MKSHLNAHVNTRYLLNLALTLGLALPLPSLAASVALATSPLATSTTSSVMPNIMFMLDDSGSMDWDYMPDDAKNFSGKYGYNTNHCNGVYYNPAITYTAPVKSDGTSFPDASFTGAWKSGYNTGLGTVNLGTSYTGGSGSGSSGINLTPGPAFYYTYSGTQNTGVQMDFHNTNSIFYKECISAVGSTTAVDGTHPVNTIFTKHTLGTSETTTLTITAAGGGATITVTGNNRTIVSNVTVNGVQILDAATSRSSTNTTVASNIAAGINNCTNAVTGNCTTAGGTGFSATVSGNVVTILGPSPYGGFSPVVTNGTCTSPCMSYTTTAFPVVSPTYVSGITVGGVSISGSTATTTLRTVLAADIAAAINPPYSAIASGNVVTITGPVSAGGYTPVVTTVPASGGLTVTAGTFPETDPVKLTNFANWYSYYSNRMLMMKTGVGQAFSSIGDTYRVGFMTMNNNVSPDIVDINTFTGGCAVGSGTCQKDKWYTKLYAAKPGNSTPLREALSHVGQLYAHKFGTYYTYTATITVSNGGAGNSTGVSSIQVNGTETMAGTSASNTSTTTVAANIAAQINLLDPSDYGATASGSVVTITGPPSAKGFYPIVSDDGGGMNFTTTAFVQNTISAQLNGILPADPVQYSCQQNFVILSTDGYWNGSTTYDLNSPAQPVGNQDSTAPRPMYDGATATMTTSQNYQSQNQYTLTTSQILSRTTQIQSSTSTLQQNTGTMQWRTKRQQTNQPLQWQTKQKQTTAPLTWTTKQQQATGSLQWATKQQATSGTLTWTTKQQQATGSLQWATKQQATSGTLTWTTKQQDTSATLTWTTKNQILVGYLQSKASGSWANVAANGTCTGKTSVCRLNATTSLFTVAAPTIRYLNYGEVCTAEGSFTSTSSTSATDTVGSGGTITSCSVNASFNPTVTNLTAGQTCAGSSNVQCGTTSSVGPSYVAYPGGPCTVTYNGSAGTSTADATTGKVVTACQVNASFNPTVTNLTAGQTCTGGGNVQCGTASTSTNYVTTYPGTCAVTYNGSTGTSTADATTGKVVTVCPAPSASYGPATSVGANGTCNGSLANIQCSNAGAFNYTTYASPTCTATFNGAAGTTTADASGNVISCQVNASFNPTVTNLTAGQTCTGGGNVQCGTASTSTNYVTTYPGTCAVTYNGSTGTSTADATTGKVVTVCPAPSASYGPATSVGANGTCNGSLANIQCSNAGAFNYTTYASPTCTATFNGAAGTTTADASGNVISCQVNASFNPTVTNLTAGQTCTGGGNVQCGTGTTTTGYVTTYPGTCSVTYNGTTSSSTADASGNVVTACPTSTSWSPAANIGANMTCSPSSLINCPVSNSSTTSYVTSPSGCSITWTSASAASTSDASGNVVTSCPTPSGFTSWSSWANVASGNSCTPGTYDQCQYSWSGWTTSAGACTVNYSSGAGAWNITSGTNCQYTGWSSYVNSSSCTALPQSSAPNYTVTTAVQCGLTDTGWVGAPSCTNSSSNGQTVYCNSPVTTTTGPTLQTTACTPGTTSTACIAPYTSNSCKSTTCSSVPIQSWTLVPSCTTGNSGSPNYIETDCKSVTLSTTNNVSNCTPGNSGIPNYIQTTCTGVSGGTSDTLADVAMYYYQTDLRNSSLANCTGALGTDVCYDNVHITNIDNNVKQHMTTYTLGLGTRGRMVYTSKDYMNDTSGDFYAVKKGLTADLTVNPPICSWQTTGSTCNWPVPSSGSINNIDDLWHAAVNGRGTYFSATDPAALSDGLYSALSSITARKGSAAAAATSTLNPVSGNNFAYVASYTTVLWTGNLEARTINTSNGVISKDASWCLESISADTCVAPSYVVTSNNGNSTISSCITPNSSLSTCSASSGTFDSTNNTCSVQVALACSGTLPPMVGPNSDTRKIITAGSASTAGMGLVDFTYNNLTPTQQGYFNNISGLSQWSSYTAAQQTAAAGANLVNYLRGQNGYEERSTNLINDQIYRFRQAVLGDALESQPTFIAGPTFSYADTGYTAFANSLANRPGTVYMGVNDGMLHAFDAQTGVERWAFVPSEVMPNMWKLADDNYSTQHVNYVNGSPVISDFYCTQNCGSTGGAAQWRTILVGGLNAGGREYYALDVTDPTAPSLLWEFTPSQDADLGYSYGMPVITKLSDGTWVVLITTGYDNGTKSGDPTVNNSPQGSGIGYLYVLDARTGSIISKLSTGVGTATTPSGLAKIAAWSSAATSNEASYVYGGDLLGNLWRFDINAPTSSLNPMLFAVLKDPSGVVQPITTSPTLGLILNKRVIFVGTGKYLETSDLTNPQVETIYAIKDDDATSTLNNPRAYTAPSPNTNKTPNLMVKQTMTYNGNYRVITDPVLPCGPCNQNPVDFSVDRGWYIDLPDTGERVNIDSKLVLGALLIPSIVPSNTVCSPGGYGWMNFLDFTNGWPITDGTGVGVAGTNTNVSVKYDATIVGMNILYIQGKPIVEIVTSDNPTPTVDSNVIINPGTSTFSGSRVQWRELLK